MWLFAAKLLYWNITKEAEYESQVWNYKEDIQHLIMFLDTEILLKGLENFFMLFHC